MLIAGVQEVLSVKAIETNIVQEDPSDKILLILNVNRVTRSKNVVAVVLIEEVEFRVARPA
jgi:hypothetical protein